MTSSVVVICEPPLPDLPIVYSPRTESTDGLRELYFVLHLPRTKSVTLRDSRLTSETFLNVLPTDGALVDLQPLLDRLTMDTATDLLFGASTSSLRLETEESAEKVHQAVKVSLRAHFRDVALGLLGRMLPDRTYFRARHIFAKQWTNMSTMLLKQTREKP